MKKFFCLLFCLALFASTYAQTDKRLKGIDKDLNAILEATKAAGFSVAVVDGDQVIYAKGFGYSDYENKVATDANTLFAIGSATKAFTSAILGQLRAEDKLSFDDSPFPSDSIGIVVLANQDGSSVPTLVRNTIADRLFKGKITDWTKDFVERREKAKKMQEEIKLEESATTQVKNTKPSHVMRDFTGSYENPGYGSFKVSVENDSLFANLKRKKLYLKHYHYDVFEPYEVTKTGIDTTNASPMHFNFATGDGGQISKVAMKAEAALEPIAFKRTPNTIDVSTSDLEMYVGEYNLMGTTLKIYIKNETVLYLFVPGQPEYELMPIEKHKFSLKAADGFKIEFLENGNVIADMNLIQPNGIFKAKKE